ncbi:RibD-like protein [Frankia torreyi]|uniref:RibD-like protein n=1 Tax=Frankia torreyi TaxID=1856 RepID=A0A0D8BAA5_9ACTN|nr:MULTISPECIES: dihydrofolate reductase family protein [Frankia]KJE21126.1 RibD-like protein [Frankia torreyi]KQM03205.1 RibD-like protein [Frankia sp. CpI1-P]
MAQNRWVRGFRESRYINNLDPDGRRGAGVAGRVRHPEGGPIIVPGSASLNHGLFDAGLIDRYHPLVFPLLLGAGKRLFSTTDQDTRKLTLVEHGVYANGLRKNGFAMPRRGLGAGRGAGRRGAFP